MATSADSFTQTRIRLLRRVSYALNTNAIVEDVVTPEGPFDAALANGLAAVASTQMPGSEYRNKKSGHVLSPRDLLGAVDKHETGLMDIERLIEGIDITQASRHGGADDEWERLTQHHVDALVALDGHASLRVLDLLRGMTFDQAVGALWADECQPDLLSPKEQSMMPPIAECDECGRSTLVTEGFDDWGCGPGEGQCLACGFQRTEDDVTGNALERAFQAHP